MQGVNRYFRTQWNIPSPVARGTCQQQVSSESAMLSLSFNKIGLEAADLFLFHCISLYTSNWFEIIDPTQHRRWSHNTVGLRAIVPSSHCISAVPISATPQRRKAQVNTPRIHIILNGWTSLLLFLKQTHSILLHGDFDHNLLQVLLAFAFCFLISWSDTDVCRIVWRFWFLKMGDPLTWEIKTTTSILSLISRSLQQGKCEEVAVSCLKAEFSKPCLSLVIFIARKQNSGRISQIQKGF